MKEEKKMQQTKKIFQRFFFSLYFDIEIKNFLKFERNKKKRKFKIKDKKNFFFFFSFVSESNREMFCNNT